jgi:hypothetical protein
VRFDRIGAPAVRLTAVAAGAGFAPAALGAFPVIGEPTLKGLLLAEAEEGSGWQPLPTPTTKDVDGDGYTDVAAGASCVGYDVPSRTFVVKQPAAVVLR